MSMAPGNRHATGLTYPMASYTITQELHQNVSSADRGVTATGCSRTSMCGIVVGTRLRALRTTRPKGLGEQRMITFLDDQHGKCSE